MKRKESVDWKIVEDGNKSGILIVSKPSTAHVFIDADDTEVRVGKLRIVSSGTHMLTIEEEGHEDFTRGFSIIGLSQKGEGGTLKEQGKEMFKKYRALKRHLDEKKDSDGLKLFMGVSESSSKLMTSLVEANRRMMVFCDEMIEVANKEKEETK